MPDIVEDRLGALLRGHFPQPVVGQRVLAQRELLQPGAVGQLAGHGREPVLGQVQLLDGRPVFGDVRRQRTDLVFAGLGNFFNVLKRGILAPIFIFIISYFYLIFK